MNRSRGVAARTLTGLIVLAGLTGAPTASGEPPATPAKAAGPAAKAKVYDEAADSREQITAALARAASQNRRVLVQWGGNWCPWCVRLHELFRSDRAIAKVLQYEYDLVYVDAGRPAGKNMDLARSYGADLAVNGFPFLTILDADGAVVANQETAALEVKGPDGQSKGVEAGHDPAVVLKFLEAHQAAPLKAQDLLDQGLARAKESGKLAFVHFGAPWCGWCRKLEAWMARADVAPVLGKAFVDVKIDQDRTVGGKDLLARYSGGKSGGIPWFVLLDGSGRAVIDSTGPQGNVGFPAAPEEIEHFGAMLRKTGRLSEAEITGLLDSLRAAARPAG